MESIKKYTLTVFNTCTQEYEEVAVTEEVYRAYYRTGWNIKDNTHILLENVPGLAPTSLLLLEQLRTIDRKRLRGYIGRISKEKMLEIDAALAISVGIGYPNERRTHNV